MSLCVQTPSLYEDTRHWIWEVLAHLYPTVFVSPWFQTRPHSRFQVDTSRGGGVGDDTVQFSADGTHGPSEIAVDLGLGEGLGQFL